VTVNAIDRCNALEAALMARVGSIYADALRTATKKRAAFLRKIEAIDEGRIKPPQYYIDTDQVDKWRQGFVRELIRQENVIEGIMEELNRAGVQAADEIKSTMPEYYAINREEAVKLLSDGMHNAGLMDFSVSRIGHRSEQFSRIYSPPFPALRIKTSDATRQSGEGLNMSSRRQPSWGKAKKS
jgi:hypothetical protein